MTLQFRLALSLGTLLGVILAAAILAAVASVPWVPLLVTLALAQGVAWIWP